MTGPWRHSEQPLYGEDGGHGMILHDFSGNLLLALHQPNGGPERAQLLKLKEQNDRLVVER